MWWTRAQVGVLLISNVIISQPTHAAPTNYHMQQPVSQVSTTYLQPTTELTTYIFLSRSRSSVLVVVGHFPARSLAVAFLLFLSSSKKCLLFYSLFYFY
jgi:hypothetical protein